MPEGVDPVFNARMLELKAQAAGLYESLTCKAQRSWQVPAAQTASMFDIANMHMPAYDRTKLNSEYNAIVLGKDPTDNGGGVLALRLQIAAVAVEERTFRHRHMSVVRAICNAHGRSYGQGYGSLFGPNGIAGDVADYIKAGSAVTEGMLVEPPPEDKATT